MKGDPLPSWVLLEFGLGLPAIVEMPWPWCMAPGKPFPSLGLSCPSCTMGRRLDHTTQSFLELLFYDYDEPVGRGLGSP